MSLLTHTKAYQEARFALCSSRALPFFCYDLDALKHHAHRLVQSKIKLFYAVKANPLSRILRVLKDLDYSFDVASRGELNQSLKQGIAPSRIIYTGPAKSRDDLAYFLDLGVRFFVAEGPNQILWLNQLAPEPVQALLRVQWQTNPLNTQNVIGGQAASAFGMYASDWLKVDIKAFKRVNVIGVHNFQWSNVGDLRTLETLWMHSALEAKRFAKVMRIPLDVLDIGGGIGIPYDASQPLLTWESVQGVIDKVQAQLSPNTQMYMELGRYLVGLFGDYMTSVVDAKQAKHVDMLLLASGVNHLVRSALVGAYFPIDNCSGASHVPRRSFKLFGPLCTNLDYLGTHDLAENTQVNDWLVFRHCGAYAFTESMPFFLCHDLPAEWVFYQGKLKEVRSSVPASTWLK